MSDNFLDQCIYLTNLGYNLSLIIIYGQEGIRLTKNYSTVKKGVVLVEQVIHWNKLGDSVYIDDIVNFMLDHIKNQEHNNSYFTSILEE